MHKLDNPQTAFKLDPDKALDSVDLLGEQLRQVWQEFKKVKVPSSYKNVTKIVISAMGGSGLPGHLVQAVYASELKKPLQIINGYEAPASVDKNTLYIICSYSGTTEEPLASYIAVQKSGAKIFGITSGGQLAGLIRQGKFPGYIFDPVANPSKQPRIGIGYAVAAHLALFNKLGFIKITDSQVKSLLLNIDSFKNNFGFKVLFSKNPAKQLAQKAQSKSLLVVASEHLAGSAHIFSNQINETAKTLATYHLIPELNHHLLEGLEFPIANRKNLAFIFLDSKLYHPKNQIRYKITKKIVVKNKVPALDYQLRSEDKLTQAFESLSLSSYVTFYLAIINNINPNLIPWVDLFKTELRKFK